MYGYNYHGHPIYLTQGGGGVGSFFSNLFREVLPLITTGTAKLFGMPGVSEFVNEAAESALKAGVNIASDTLSGKNVLKSTGTNLQSMQKDLISKLEPKKSKLKAKIKASKPKSKKSVKTVKATAKKRSASMKKTKSKRKKEDLFG